MDVIAGSVAFVVVLVAVNVEQVELVDQAVFFEHVERAVDGDLVDARVDLLGAIEQRAGVEVALGLVHHLNQDAALAREANSPLGERGTQAAVVSVDSLAAGDAMGSWIVHRDIRFKQSTSAAEAACDGELRTARLKRCPDELH